MMQTTMLLQMMMQATGDGGVLNMTNLLKI
jgi:hypothetical protein